MSKLIILEGPNCVGKTGLANFLSKQLNIQIYEHIVDQHVWKDPRDGYMEFATLYNMGKYPGVELICDRGLFSFAYYNREWNESGVFIRWFEDLFKWDSAKVICMMSTMENLERNAERKSETEGEHEGVEKEELLWFSNSFSLVPCELKIDCHITDYDEFWMEKICQEVK